MRHSIYTADRPRCRPSRAKATTRDPGRFNRTKGMTLAQKKTARKANAVTLGLTGAAGNKMVTRIQKGKPNPPTKTPTVRSVGPKGRGLGNTY